MKQDLDNITAIVRLSAMLLHACQSYKGDGGPGDRLRTRAVRVGNKAARALELALKDGIVDMEGKGWPDEVRVSWIDAGACAHATTCERYQPEPNKDDDEEPGAQGNDGPAPPSP
jgi:hypothetical protein